MYAKTWAPAGFFHRWKLGGLEAKVPQWSPGVEAEKIVKIMHK